MGYASALDFATVADETIALSWHLTSNHYPPLPVSLIPTCVAAIDAAVEGDPHREVNLPDGVTYQDRTSAPAHAIVEAHHLHAFIDARLQGFE